MSAQAYGPQDRRHRWSPSPGLVVAVLGPDGAGKSTLIARINESVRGTVPYIVGFHLRPPLRRGRASAGPVTDPHGRAPRPAWVSWLKVAYYVLTYRLGYLISVRPHLARSALVLFDRYYDDLLVDPRRYRYGGPMTLARWARRFIPRPDLTLVLDVPEAQMLERKQEVSSEELRRQRAAYARLGRDLPDAVLLDGSCPIDEVARRACHVIIARLRQREDALLGRPHAPRRLERPSSSASCLAGDSSVDPVAEDRARAQG